MRHAGLFAVGLFGLAPAGCGPEKEAPTAVVRPTDREPPPAAPIPAASDPAAVELVDRCLKAATDGHPERVDAGRSTKSLVKGLSGGSGGRMTAASRTIQAVWPDRFRADFEFPTGDPKQRFMGLRRPNFWMVTSGPAGLAEFAVPDPKTAGEIIAVDAVGQYWLPLLVPLTDPKTVVFDVRKETLGSQSADTVKAVVPGCPVYTLWFDPQTHLLGVVTYTHVEATGGGTGLRLQKRLGMAKHQAFGGVMLPTRLEFSRNGETVEEWGVESWDLGAAVPDDVFNSPVSGKK